MTTGRTPPQAVSNYQSAVQRVLSCITNAVADVAGGYYPSPTPHRLDLNNGLPVPLGGASRLMLRMRQNYLIVESGLAEEPWQVNVTGYNYDIYDHERREVLLYHWHPVGNSPVAAPHLHLKQGAQVGRAEVRDSHLPTGLIPLGAFLRYLVRDLGVPARRADWQLILDEGTG